MLRFPSARGPNSSSLHPRDDAVVFETIHRGRYGLRDSRQQTKAQFAVFEHLFDFRSVKGGTDAVAAGADAFALAEQMVPDI